MHDGIGPEGPIPTDEGPIPTDDGLKFKTI